MLISAHCSRKSGFERLCLQVDGELWFSHFYRMGCHNLLTSPFKQVSFDPHSNQPPTPDLCLDSLHNRVLSSPSERFPSGRTNCRGWLWPSASHHRRRWFRPAERRQCCSPRLWWDPEEPCKLGGQRVEWLYNFIERSSHQTCTKPQKIEFNFLPDVVKHRNHLDQRTSWTGVRELAFWPNHFVLLAGKTHFLLKPQNLLSLINHQKIIPQTEHLKKSDTSFFFVSEQLLKCEPALNLLSPSDLWHTMTSSNIRSFTHVSQPD